MTVKMMRSMMRFAENSSGATAVEYAVMTFIAIGIIFAVTELGGALNDLYVSFAAALP